MLSLKETTETKGDLKILQMRLMEVKIFYKSFRKIRKSTLLIFDPWSPYFFGGKFKFSQNSNFAAINFKKKNQGQLQRFAEICRNKRCKVKLLIYAKDDQFQNSSYWVKINQIFLLIFRSVIIYIFIFPYSFVLVMNQRRPVLVVNNGFSGAQGRLFKILKPLIFSSTNPLHTCIIYFCQKVSYRSFFLSQKKAFFVVHI